MAQAWETEQPGIRSMARALPGQFSKQTDGVKFWKKNKAAYQAALTEARQAQQQAQQAAEQQRLAEQKAEQERLAAAAKAEAERRAAAAIAAEEKAAADKKAAEERAAAVAAANARGVTAADFDYDAARDGRGVMITKYKGLATIVNIPAVIEGLPVTEIGGIDTGRSDYDSGGTIYDGAFQNNTEITSVTIPDSVTSVVAGGSVGGYVGGGGRGDEGTYVIRTWGAFAGCTSLKSVTLPRNLKTIPYGMFGDCSSLETITLPAGLEQIEERAFANTALKSIVLPDRITRIKEGAFAGTGLTSVVLPKNLEALGPSKGWGANAGGQGVFESCTSLESVTFQSRGLWVLLNTFWNCPSLRTLTINENVDFDHYYDEDIPFGSGDDAAPITTVNIGPNVTRIGNSDCIPTGKLSIAAKAAINRVGDNR
jgi:hypothetical protein